MEIKQINYDVKDDIRQSFVVAKNEVTKFIRGRKIILFTVLLALVTALLTAILGIYGENLTASFVCIIFVSVVPMIVLFAAVFFTATSIASEFEERTALILFTKPIRKWSIYFGKLVASIVIEGAYIVVYYIATVVISFALTGDTTGDMVASIVLAFCYVFGATGVTLVISTVMKKSSTASIMTVIVILLIFSMLSATLSQVAHIDTWWMINEAAEGISDAMGTINGSGDLVPGYNDFGRDAGVMFLWGAVATVVGFLLFRKKDF